MIEQDTVRLLRECDSGIKMGAESINSVMDKVESRRFKKLLEDCLDEHREMQKDIDVLLDKCGDDGKAPNAAASAFSKIKTGVMMTVDKSDATVADIMTDGCNMGIKSLSRYLNQYKAASEDSKNLAKRLISSEENLAVNIREYL